MTGLRCLAVGLALVAGAAAAAADDAPSAYRAAFVQTRSLPALSRPFVTRGTVEVAADGTVDWRVEAPLQVSFRIDSSGISERRADGVERRIDASRAPWLGAIGDALRALLRWDRAPLAERFTIVERGSDAELELELVPRDSQLARGLERIVVRGKDRRPSYVRIDQPGGARIEVAFDPTVR